ncbi:PTS system mannose/fructose/sorbose family transporter subunit IID [Geosporobacter ferrireducens]|uniref:PTS fructose transporter subunit IID n=1 Tax=Geosporobacter ferrireducens TaxID=1424294 RepID=A0A1D8GHG4_9FIRM|nr:PTS system mannose/fructose/sorbose family transporter subunit IID [Geosporobacter ferrireducens]AOT70324.1 PTS fructose transporter subunit IID [Geosporobacter ferrireducens]MTI54292.1 PTS system mannose/fructose/sorbose family transporter subunit IID [Geosporobacter ferrireducens]
MTEKKLSQKTLFRSWLTWFFFNGSSQSGERMQGIAFAHSMIPVIKELYQKEEDIRDALKRHLMLFNVEPQVGSVINGVTAAMEEQRANGVDIDDDTISTVKIALMGPMSGIGDTLVPGTLIPILLAIALGITNSSGLLGPAFYFLLYPTLTMAYSWYLYKFGYNAGLNGIQNVMSSGKIHALTDSLNVLGLLVMGALSASYINVTTPLKYSSGEMVLSLQEILDRIMPGMLPLAVVGMVWYLLSRRKMSPLRVMGFIFIFALIGVAIGML